MRRLLFISVPILFLSVVWAADEPAVKKHSPEDLAIGKVAPEIVGEDIDGQPMKLSDYRGKVVVLDFWGHW